MSTPTIHAFQIDVLIIQKPVNLFASDNPIDWFLYNGNMDIK